MHSRLWRQRRFWPLKNLVNVGEMLFTDFPRLKDNERRAGRHDAQLSANSRKVRLACDTATLTGSFDDRVIAHVATQPRQHLSVALILNSDPLLHFNLETCIYIQLFRTIVQIKHQCKRCVTNHSSFPGETPSDTTQYWFRLYCISVQCSGDYRVRPA